jgi:DNA-directed RNA polymerase subunit RPC12/RpoP
MLLINLKQSVRYKLSVNNLEGKLSLREKQDKRLREDVEKVLSCREWIKTITNNTFDRTRVIGIVAAAKGAENYLPYTIAKIIKQISETGMMADIVIGLNNGFECPTVIDGFCLLLNVQVIHLYTSEKLANNIPAKIYDNIKCEGEPYYLKNIDCQYCKHRIFVVHQKQGEYAAGKIRVLGDIYGSLLFKSIENGWIPPALLVTFDAESQFLVEQKYALVEPESNGLMLMLMELKNRPEIDILGTRNKFAVYQKGILDRTEVLLPNFSEEVPPLQFFLDLVHGKYRGYQWMQGGGTVGRTDVLVSLLTVISQSYPGTRTEDAHLTILAKFAGFRGNIYLDVVSTNRTPSLTDMTMDQPSKKAWIEQMFRWGTGTQGLELCYGKHNIKLIVPDGFPWSIFIDPIEFLKRLKGRDKVNLYTVIQKIKILAIAYAVSHNIRKKSLEMPDILQGDEAKAHW